MDLDLQTLRRAAARDPDLPGPWLSLAAGLSRAGARDEALEAAWRAGALGAAREDVGTLTSSLGARPSPWPELDADAQASRRSPLRGPRRGEVVAGGPGAPVFCALDADGAVLITSGGGTSVRDGRSLEQREHLPGPHSACVTARGVLALVERAKSYHSLAHLRGGGPEWKDAGHYGYVRPTVDLAGRVHVRGHVLSPDLEPLLEHPDAPAHLRASTFQDVSTVTVAPDLRSAITWRHYQNVVLGLLDPEARLVAARVLYSGQRPVFDDAGRLLVVGPSTEGARPQPSTLEALGPTGDVAWSTPVRRGGLGHHLALADAGACYFAWGDELVRVVEGRVVWRYTAERVVADPVVDREGVLYAGVIRDADKTWWLVAVGPDGQRLFALPGRATPIAIDAFGRLLATLDASLVAIA